MATLGSIARNIAGNVLPLFYEEPDVARCIMFPGAFALPGETGDRTLEFDAPGVTPGSLPAVFFQTTSDTPAASFSVRLNDPPHLVVGPLPSGEPRSWHKLGRAGSLTPQNNHLLFSVNEGDITFSDVFIVYKSNRLTVSKPIVIVAEP